VRSERQRETFDIGLRSFVNEARMLAQFDHPALIKVYRFWEANGTAYMVMPFLSGITLQDALKQRGEAPSEVWIRGLLSPLMEALAVLHEDKVYHRDIAPDNVMLLAGDRPVLLDFGAARRVISDMTHALTVILKPGYAPIEQYADMPGMKQGPWTDVYALAAVVYFMILKRKPPPAVGRLMEDNYEPLMKSEAAGRYSARLLLGIDSCLRVRAEDRPQNMAAMREAIGLGAGRRGDGGDAGVRAVASPAPRRCRRRRLAGMRRRSRCPLGAADAAAADRAARGGRRRRRAGAARVGAGPRAAGPHRVAEATTVCRRRRAGARPSPPPRRRRARPTRRPSSPPPRRSRRSTSTSPSTPPSRSPTSRSTPTSRARPRRRARAGCRRRRQPRRRRRAGRGVGVLLAEEGAAAARRRHDAAPVKPVPASAPRRAPPRAALGEPRRGDRRGARRRRSGPRADARSARGGAARRRAEPGGEERRRRPVQVFVWDPSTDRIHRLSPTTGGRRRQRQRERQVPRPGRGRRAASGPLGRWRVVALLSDKPRDLSATAFVRDGEDVVVERGALEARLASEGLAEPDRQAAVRGERAVRRPLRHRRRRRRAGSRRAAARGEAAAAGKPAPAAPTPGKKNPDSEREYMKRLNKDLDTLLGK
jgi:serine/threonine protein kinase